MATVVEIKQGPTVQDALAAAATARAAASGITADSPARAAEILAAIDAIKADLEAHPGPGGFNASPIPTSLIIALKNNAMLTDQATNQPKRIPDGQIVGVGLGLLHAAEAQQEQALHDVIGVVATAFNAIPIVGQVAGAALRAGAQAGGANTGTTFRDQATAEAAHYAATGALPGDAARLSWWRRLLSYFGPPHVA